MRILGGIGLVSASLIAYQIILMQVLSYAQWDHFAYMILAIAMLGFGVAGTALAIHRKQLISQYQVTLPWLSLLASILQIISIQVAHWEPVQFDSYLVFADLSHLLRLLFTYLLFMLPMAVGALVVGMVIVKESARIGKIYASNLLGSGFGALLILFMANYLSTTELLRLVALAALASSGLFSINLGSRRQKTFALLAGGVLIFILLSPIDIKPSQFKAISTTLNLPDAKIEVTLPSSRGRIEAVSSKHLRYAPAVSLHYPHTVSANHLVFENGNLKGPVFDSSSDRVLSHSVFHLPWLLGPFEKVLMINPGTAPMLSHFLEQGASQVSITSPNPQLASLLKGPLQLASNGIFNQSTVEVLAMEPRVFFKVSPKIFDLVILPDVNQLGGDSGINSLAQNFTLTREGLAALRNRLSENGVIGVNCWMDYPPKYPLRVLNTLIAFLNGQGLAHPEGHVLAIRNWGAVSFLVRLTPFSSLEVEKVKEFCKTNGFDPVVLAGQPLDPAEIFNELQHNLMPEGLAQILNDPDGKWVENYPFNLHATTDDRPFFNQFVKMKEFMPTSHNSSLSDLATIEAGTALVWLSLVQVVFLVIVLIALPVIVRPKQLRNKLWTFCYFTGLGLGFMVVELVLIHKISFFMGNAVIASGLTIGGILIWSGLGSYWSNRIVSSEAAWTLAIWLILLLVAIYGLYFSNLLGVWLTYPEPVKAGISLLTLAPVGILMGLPFARGVTYLTDIEPSAIPWAWGVNSCFAVVAPILSTVLALQFGFQSLFVLAGIGYALAGLSMFSLRTSSSALGS